MASSYASYLQAANRYDIIPVYEVIDEDLLTPISIFMKLEAFSPTYILESVSDPTTDGRYSIIGLDTEPLFNPEVNEKLEAFKSSLSNLKIPEVDELPPYFAGIIGYMAYNAIEESFPITLNHQPSIPMVQFLFSKTVVLVDHLKHQIAIVCNTTHPDSETYQTSLDRIIAIKDALTAPLLLETAVADKPDPLCFTSNFEKDRYFSAVDKAKEYILAGDIFQVVLSQKFTAKGQLDGFTLYRELRKQNPAPYLSYIRFPGMEVLCSSPEMLVKMSPDTLETAPIAGTRSVKGDGLDDQRAYELKHDPKDNAEHLMLVDLGRNDIGKVSKPGTVKVPQYAEVKRFSKVMHLVSSVTGTPVPGLSPVDALTATFPAGTVSGAPKLRAMEIINELEPDSRDLYAGAILMLNQYGHMSSCIAIRTIQLRGNEIIVQAGGGIVHDSNPQHEYLEIMNKSRAMFTAIEKAYKGDVHYDFDYR